MDDWTRLGEHVVNRRVRLKMLTRGALATRSGVSTRVLGDIENGRRGNYDPVTLAALEQALDWETGSARRVLGGGDPVELAGDRPVGGRAELAIRRIEDVLDHPGLEDSWRVNTIRGIVFNYRRSLARPAATDVAQPDDGEEGRLAAG